MLDRTVIAMSSDMDENDEAITGFVQSIEEDADAVPRRWRITILETGSQCSTRPTLRLFGAAGSQKNRVDSGEGGFTQSHNSKVLTPEQPMLPRKKGPRIARS